MTITPEFFDLQGASAYTGGALSVRTLRRLISRPGGLVFYRINRGKIMLKRSDLDGYLERYRKEPLDLDKLAAQALREMAGSVK
jgi:hypothetical protein